MKRKPADLVIESLKGPVYAWTLGELWFLWRASRRGHFERAGGRWFYLTDAGYEALVSWPGKEPGDCLA